MTTHKWYVTSQWYAWRTERGQVQRVPAGPAHAKTFGATTTACGLPCDSWVKFWHLPYLECRQTEICLACNSAITSKPTRPADTVGRRRSFGTRESR